MQNFVYFTLILLRLGNYLGTFIKWTIAGDTDIRVDMPVVYGLR